VKINPRRVHNNIDGYLESDNDYLENNLEAAVRLLDQELARQSARPPKSGPWIVVVRRNRRTNYVTAASTDVKGNIIAESVQLVNVRGGAHGFSFNIASQLVNYFGGDIAEAENIVG